MASENKREPTGGAGRQAPGHPHPNALLKNPTRRFLGRSYCSAGSVSSTSGLPARLSRPYSPTLRRTGTGRTGISSGRLSVR